MHFKTLVALGFCLLIAGALAAAEEPVVTPSVPTPPAATAAATPAATAPASPTSPATPAATPPAPAPSPTVRPVDPNIPMVPATPGPEPLPLPAQTAGGWLSRHAFRVLYEHEDPAYDLRSTTVWYREHTRRNPSLFANIQMKEFASDGERDLARLEWHPLDQAWCWLKLGRGSFDNTLYYVNEGGFDQFSYDDGPVWGLGLGGLLPAAAPRCLGLALSARAGYLRQENELNGVQENLPRRGISAPLQVSSLRFGSRNYLATVEGDALIEEWNADLCLHRPLVWGLSWGWDLTLDPFIGFEYFRRQAEGDAHARMVQYDIQYVAYEDIHWEAESRDDFGLLVGFDAALNDRFQVGAEWREGGGRAGSFDFTAGLRF